MRSSFTAKHGVKNHLRQLGSMQRLRRWARMAFRSLLTNQKHRSDWDSRTARPLTEGFGDARPVASWSRQRVLPEFARSTADSQWLSSDARRQDKWFLTPFPSAFLTPFPPSFPPCLFLLTFDLEPSAAKTPASDKK
jgi:hypothetical protein